MVSYAPWKVSYEPCSKVPGWFLMSPVFDKPCTWTPAASAGARKVTVVIEVKGSNTGVPDSETAVPMMLT